jgi:signal transduction histidine kinase
VLKRVKRAHELAREGLTETRRGVGALRADAQPVTPAAAGIEALVSEYRSASNAKVTVTIDGAPTDCRTRSGRRWCVWFRNR